MTMLIRLNCRPSSTIAPLTTYQLRAIGMNDRMALQMLRKETSSTISTKIEDISTARSKSRWTTSTMSRI